MSCSTTIETLSARICGLISDNNENTIKYKIQVSDLDSAQPEGEHHWILVRRYSDFDALHKKLVETNGIPRGNISLPPKRVLGNKEPDFIEQRRQQLDKYLSSIVTFFKLNPPEELAKFLELYEYHVMFLLRKLAIDIFENGDSFLQTATPRTFSPYQIFAINERMKMAIPSLTDSTDKRQDFSHIIDFCTSVQCLDIIGSNIPIGSSTIIPNQYSFGLQPFKSIRQLTVKQINCEKLCEVSSVRQTVECLMVQNCCLQSTNELLLADTIYKKWSEAGPGFAWPQLSSLSLTNNMLSSVEDIGLLLPSLKLLDLSFNQLTTVFNLTGLPFLETVNYGGNLITSPQPPPPMELATGDGGSFPPSSSSPPLLPSPPPFHLLFGQICKLDFSSNQLTELRCFSGLYSLVELNLSCNHVRCIEEVEYLGSLPCLDVLILTGNPVASSIDYRVRALTYFSKRAADITLDNEKASSIELDQISILQAIQLARQTSIN